MTTPTFLSNPFITPLFACALLLLTGCLSSDAQRHAVTQKKSYALEADAPAAVAATPRFGHLKILSFKSQPPYEANSLIVKRANGETVMDYYTTWIASPHDLIRVQSMNYLRDSGLFKAVYDSTSGSLAQAGLEGTLEQIFLDVRAEKTMAVITLRFTIIDETTTDFTMLWSSEATGQAEVDAPGPLAMTSAFNKALTKALAQLTRELERASLPHNK